MRTKIKKMLPQKAIHSLKRMKTKKQLNDLYQYDKRRFEDSAYGIREELTENNLRSKITFHYHAIEKGLSNADIRLGFGKAAFEQLFFSMDKFIEMGYSTEDERFQTAISVIHKYVDMHKKYNHEVNSVEDKLRQYSKYLLKDNMDLGGYLSFTKDKLPEFSSLTFESLAKERFSVREYSEEEVNQGDVMAAIQIATESPSVCNRQSWKVHYLKNQRLINDVLDLQGGFRANGKNLKDLILVTCDTQYMNGPHERNQAYIDGGLFAMSLLYGLESKGLATCTLNTNFTIEKDQKMRKLIGLSASENFIAFITVGNYPKEFKVAKSPKDPATIITNVIV
ncbi:nitroreductase family protein [Marinilactibacillus kalidii]|uniref:nitroreductase family protein n=1 Tax=Marinilactibacillus kalidii TaxID=2820274 RepID=UPI001ABE7D44|nr:nitroreductase family protein [Marinilactibacillus kalidii]